MRRFAPYNWAAVFHYYFVMPAKATLRMIYDIQLTISAFIQQPTITKQQHKASFTEFQTYFAGIFIWESIGSFFSPDRFYFPLNFNQ